MSVCVACYDIKLPGSRGVVPDAIFCNMQYSMGYIPHAQLIPRVPFVLQRLNPLRQVWGGHSISWYFQPFVSW
jgi:hypothetical protein